MLPEGLAGTGEEEQSADTTTTTIRLRCEACENAYQYPLTVLYVDEERIEQRQMPTARDIWTPEAFTCKNCHKPIDLEPDDRFLKDLFAELLAARMVKPSSEDMAILDHIRLIQFPRLNGTSQNPARFLLEAAQIKEEDSQPAEHMELWMELGRFHLETENLEAAKNAFSRVLAGSQKQAEALYSLGVIAFQEKNLYEARVYFSRVTQTFSREDFENDMDNPVDMSQHYLKLLDKREFKRSHFQLISS